MSARVQRFVGACRYLAALVSCALLISGCGHGAEEPRSLPPGTPPSFIAQSHDAFATLVAGGTGGVFSSRDAGRTWQRLPVPRAVGAAFTDEGAVLARGRLLHRAASDLHAIDPGRRSNLPGAVTALSGRRKLDMAADVNAATGEQLWLSHDAGSTWARAAARGLPQGVLDLALGGRPDAPLVLYAAAGAAGLWRSRDGGASFERLAAAGAPVRRVAATVARDGMLLIATPRVRVSRDDGLTWLDAPIAATALAGGARNPDLWFAMTPAGQLRVSRDGGTTW